FREEGKTVVFVSHDLQSIERFCRRALVLQNGEIQALGPAERVVPQYRRGTLLERAGEKRGRVSAASAAAPRERRIEWISRAEANSGAVVGAHIELARSVLDV